MHPAYSVILFTTLSGAGYGMLILLGLLGPLGWMPAGWTYALPVFALAFALVTGGLLSSTFHLGHPERAWRAVTQWRSSWLSREGVVALAAYVPAGLFALLWLIAGRVGQVAWLGWVTALSALATLYCTGMIYASLPTIRQWRHPLVVAGYIVFGLASGAVILAAVTQLYAPAARLTTVALAALAAALLIKLFYWRRIDLLSPLASAESATGLGRIGRVHELERPHTADNYVMQEMGYRVARRHRMRLRRLALLAAFLLPSLLLALDLLIAGPLGGILAWLALLSMVFGLLIERWLFFAEATHVVTTFYGAPTA